MFKKNHNIVKYCSNQKFCLLSKWTAGEAAQFLTLQNKKYFIIQYLNLNHWLKINHSLGGCKSSYLKLKKQLSSPDYLISFYLRIRSSLVERKLSINRTKLELSLLVLLRNIEYSFLRLSTGIVSANKYLCLLGS